MNEALDALIYHLEEILNRTLEHEEVWRLTDNIAEVASIVVDDVKSGHVIPEPIKAELVIDDPELDKLINTWCAAVRSHLGPKICNTAATDYLRDELIGQINWVLENAEA